MVQNSQPLSPGISVSYVLDDLKQLFRLYAKHLGASTVHGPTHLPEYLLQPSLHTSHDGSPSLATRTPRELLQEQHPNTGLRKQFVEVARHMGVAFQTRGDTRLGHADLDVDTFFTTSRATPTEVGVLFQVRTYDIEEVLVLQASFVLLQEVSHLDALSVLVHI